MSVSFDVYRIGQDGQRELVRTTQSAREAREVRDTAPDEMLVVVSDDGVIKDDERVRATADEFQGDIEDDHLL
jgi:hypothetical protein